MFFNRYMFVYDELEEITSNVPAYIRRMGLDKLQEDNTKDMQDFCESYHL